MDNKSGYKRNWLTKRDYYRRPGEKYLSRYVIFRCENWGIYIHRFWVSDFNVHHDHPWDFIAMPLTVGYREHFLDGSSVWRSPFSLPKFRKAEDFHWVELEKGPCWTFFIHFKNRREWGFQTKEGWIEHQTYNKMMGVG